MLVTRHGYPYGMSRPSLHWRSARLPEKTAVFAVGDIHAQHTLLRPMLQAIEEKIALLPPGVTAQVIFIGDYIDRGASAPATIDMLLDFERRMKSKSNVKTTFLCGNHDEYLKRLLEAPGFTDRVLGNPADPGDHRHCVSAPDGSLAIKGLEAWLFSGGGLKTMQDYMPALDPALFDMEHQCFNRAYPGFGPGLVEATVKAFAARVPQAHKDFFARIYPNSHVILGDYLFTHAGVFPDRPLAAQGIGEGASPLQGTDYLDFLMLRNSFLWREENALPHCPYVVVHGHTPSAIASGIGTLADGQKDYRLCIDTDVYRPHGALTCFTRCGDTAGFLSVSNKNPGRVNEYSIPEVGQWAAHVLHSMQFPQYHGQVTPAATSALARATNRKAACLPGAEACR